MTVSTDTTMHPAYILRAYIWKVLKTNMPDPWDEADYGGMIPIVPVNEEPDLDEFSGPHIVYGYAEASGGGQHHCSYGSMTFAVYDDNFRRLTKTLNIMKHALERHDETARDLNRFTDSVPAYDWLRFGTVALGFVEGGTPETTEGGRQSAILNIRFEYFAEYNITTAVTN